MAENLLRQLPQVEKLLQLPGLKRAAQTAPRGLVTDALRAVLAELRGDILARKLSADDLRTRLSEAEIERRFEAELHQRQLSGYRRVINATGVILHTGLGRAVLAEPAREALARELSGYSMVEVDVETAERNQRESKLAELLCSMTQAEAATVVNNNAAATLLCLAALARGKEVVVSRGQLVEIGGSFRIPDILRESGAALVEVGTTNRTYLSDYRAAIGPETGMLLQVHTSNYAIHGFEHSTSLEDLVKLGNEHGVPVVSDLGSGCFVDLRPFGFDPEPLVHERVQTGVDLVCFSGDKLLGGPQAGVIVGKAAAIQKVRSHPLFRVLRVDKMTLVALEATLGCYSDPENLAKTIPALRAIMASEEEVYQRALETLGELRRAVPRLVAAVEPAGAQAGSGALPAQEIRSSAITLRHADLPSAELARRLRLGTPPVFSRVQRDKVFLDFRTILLGEESELVAAVARAAV